MESKVRSLKYGVSKDLVHIPYVLAELTCFHVIEGKEREVGDVVECENCDKQLETMNILRSRKVEILHARYRPAFNGTYSFYRRDEDSPSGKMLMASLDANPNTETFLREIGVSPLSPTEMLHS